MKMSFPFKKRDDFLTIPVMWDGEAEHEELYINS